MIRLFPAIIFLCTIFSCMGNRAPGEVAVVLFNAITEGDADVVKKNIHFAYEGDYDVFSEYLDMAIKSEDFAQRTEGYKADYKVLSEVVTGDSAYVVLQGRTVLEQVSCFKVRMVRIDGKWKVDGDYSVFTRE